jgi:murein DD-endopeptidase MepM/ murein hydrolase activator NlpD
MGLPRSNILGLLALLPVFLGACASHPVQVAESRTPLPGAPVVAQMPKLAPNVVKVGAGDTVYGIAKRADVPVRAVIDANRLAAPFRLELGQEIYVPRGITHTVAVGETLYGISRRYGVGSFSLAKLNRVAAPYSLTAGQTLRLPLSDFAELPPQPQPALIQPQRLAQPVPAASPSPETAPRSPPPVAQDRVAALPTPQPTPTPAPTPSAAPAVGPPVASLIDRDSGGAGAPKFSWPVKGAILSTFGAKSGGLHNDGINIAAKPGATVLAAQEGVVVYAGNELKGYGNLVLVRHASGWLSAYAHNREILVKRDQRVTRGQPIAKVGSTGSVTKPQLHFEIRNGTQAIDPLPHLS